MAKGGKSRIGSLSVALSLNSAAFNAGLKRVRRRMRRFSRNMGAAIKRVTKFGAVLGTAAIAGISIFTRRAMQSIDASAKLADRLGLATEELAGLQHAASIMGSSAEEMNKALEQFVRRIGEAQTGTGEAKMALDRLGISADTLAKKSPAEAMKDVADVIAGLEDQTQKAEVAYRMFGRQGVKLLNTLSLGRRGIEDMQREAQRLGITFDRIDAAQIENANDAITRLKAVFRGAFNVLAIKLAPVITEFADRLTGVGTAGEGMGHKIAMAFETALILVGKLADAIVWLKTQFAKVAVAINAFIKPVLDALAKLDDWTNWLPGGGGGETGKALRGASAALEENMKYWSRMAVQGGMGPRPSERIGGFLQDVQNRQFAAATANVQAGAGRAGPTREQLERLIASNERVAATVGNVGRLE